MRSSRYFPTGHKVGKSRLDQNPHRLIQVFVQFLCEYNRCGTKELLASDNIDQFLHKIRSLTVKFFLEPSE